MAAGTRRSPGTTAAVIFGLSRSNPGPFSRISAPYAPATIHTRPHDSARPSLTGRRADQT